MTVLDSSAWLAMMTDQPSASRFRRLKDEADTILVPTIVLYEVYKIVARRASWEVAELAAMELQQHEVVDLDSATALTAADLSLEHRLAMADAIVYATAQLKGATLVSGDADFADLPGVEYIALDEGS